MIFPNSIVILDIFLLSDMIDTAIFIEKIFNLCLLIDESFF